MPSNGSEDTFCQPDEPTTAKHRHCLLLSLPIELREKIYIYVFANVFARRTNRNSSQPLAILQTSARVHGEASSVFFNRTPLRFMIGHIRRVTSIPPPKSIIDRFQNVFFKIQAMNSTHSGYDFEIPFKELTEAFVHSTVHRKNCYIKCELEEHASGYCGRQFQARIKSFTGFETLTINFEGTVLKKEFPREAVADDDSQKAGKLSLQDLREGVRQREYASLADVEKMLRMLKRYLGKGEILDVSEGSEALYARTLVFHPLQHVTRTQR